MDIIRRIDEIYQSDSRKVLATLIRYLNDFDLAEDALADAFAAATESWPKDGVPANPTAWLVSTGRFKAIDAVRRQSHLAKLSSELVQRLDRIVAWNSSNSDQAIEDDRLRLIFTCCHPAIDPQVQVALTLREVCGLTTEEIASAFLVAPATMAQRIVRGKSKIRDAGIPFCVPQDAELSERLESVLSVCYLVFNEGYSASSGESHTRCELSGEAIRLGRLLCDLMPDTEVFGLLALMLFHESRRAARTNPAGDVVLLEDQDRSRWDRDMIREAHSWLARAISTGEVGSYTIQAAISSVHAGSITASETNWQQIVEWYDLLMQATPSYVVELNRAVAIAMRDGPSAGLALMDAIAQRTDVRGYHHYHAARAELLRRLGQFDEARIAFQQALSLSKQDPERRLLLRRIMEMEAAQRG